MDWADPEGEVLRGGREVTLCQNRSRRKVVETLARRKEMQRKCRERERNGTGWLETSEREDRERAEAGGRPLLRPEEVSGPIARRQRLAAGVAGRRQGHGLLVAQADRGRGGGEGLGVGRGASGAR